MENLAPVQQLSGDCGRPKGHEEWRKTLFVAESMYKYLQTHWPIEVFKLCITKSANKFLQL